METLPLLTTAHGLAKVTKKGDGRTAAKLHKATAKLVLRNGKEMPLYPVFEK
jgi:hypothetical protein